MTVILYRPRCHKGTGLGFEPRPTCCRTCLHACPVVDCPTRAPSSPHHQSMPGIDMAIFQGQRNTWVVIFSCPSWETPNTFTRPVRFGHVVILFSGGISGCNFPTLSRQMPWLGIVVPCGCARPSWNIHPGPPLPWREPRRKFLWNTSLNWLTI